MTTDERTPIGQPSSVAAGRRVSSTGGTIRRCWPLILLIVGILAIGWNVYYRAIQDEAGRSDFLMLHAAGRAVLDGTDIYSVRHPRGWPFYYPPTMAVVMAPLSVMPLPAAVVAWYAISVAGLLWAGYRLVRLCDDLTAQAVGPIVVAAFLVNFGPIVAGLQRGQVGAILFAMMVEAFWCYRQGRSARCGLWIALAASLKVYPVLLVLPLAVRRDWRGLAGFTCGLLVSLCLVPMAVMGPATGLRTSGRWAGSIVLPFFTDGSYADREVFAQFNQFSPSNQSLFGALARWMCRSAVPAAERFPLSVADLPPDAARYAAAGVSAVLLAVLVGLALRRMRRDGLAEALLWSLCTVATCFISHIAWHHYYVVLTMLYALAGAVLVTGSAGRRRRWLVAALAVAVACNWLHFAVFFCRLMGMLMFGSLVLWGSLASVAAAKFTSERRRGA